MGLAPEITDDYFNLICASTVVWFSIYIYTFITIKSKEHFGTNPFCMSGHAVVAVLLCISSLYFNDESKFPEAFVVCYGIGFFIVDTFDCIVRMDFMFSLHGILGLIFFYCASLTQYYNLRAGSMGYFVEASTPFYHRWKGKKTKETMGHFLLVFFLTRIVWSPIFLHKIYSVAELDKLTIYGFTMFYVLNCAWFMKGVQLYMNYEKDYKKDKKHDSKRA